MPSFDLIGILRELVLVIPGFLMAITFHEVAHGYAAYRLGDPTAKLAGRLSLNPLKHLDPVGTLVLVLTRMIGWAKPVPVDGRYFKNPMRDHALVSLAGPAANFATAVGLALLLTLLDAAFGGREVSKFTGNIIEPLALILYLGVRINLILGIFNLLPIPPMDGSGILAYFLPPNVADQYLSIGRYGFIIIIVLAMSGILGRILLPPVNFFLQILL